LHGHSFAVVRSAGNTTYNYANPVFRDVVSIGDTGDNVTIRFFTDNPGPWLFHCHVDWHLNAFVILTSIRLRCLFILMHYPSGFAAVFAEDVPDVPSQDYTNGTLN